MHIRSKKILLVAPENYPAQLTADYTNVRHICDAGAIFPSLFESKPDLIIFDFEFMGRNMEKTLRRLKANKFYSKVKVHCYKPVPNTKTDSFLKVIGVDHLIYREDLNKPDKDKSIIGKVGSVIDHSIKLVPSLSN